MSRSRTLRRDSTDAEAMLWGVLRSRQLGGLKFRRQVEIGGYIADFLCPERRLIIEVDGGQHRPERDARRTAYLETRGFTVIRFWNNEVLENLDGVYSAIAAAVSTPPHPSR